MQWVGSCVLRVITWVGSCVRGSLHGWGRAWGHPSENGATHSGKGSICSKLFVRQGFCGWSGHVKPKPHPRLSFFASILLLRSCCPLAWPVNRTGENRPRPRPSPLVHILFLGSSEKGWIPQGVSPQQLFAVAMVRAIVHAT